LAPEIEIYDEKRYMPNGAQHFIKFLHIFVPVWREKRRRLLTITKFLIDRVFSISCSDSGFLLTGDLARKCEIKIKKTIIGG
jgi:hypothetical protein